jgi:RHS repeat-associated protein
MQGWQEEHDLPSPTATDPQDRKALTIGCGARPWRAVRGFFSRPSRGRRSARRLGHVVVVLLSVQFALAISAVACEGGGVPVVPEPPVGGGSGSNSGTPGLGKEECGKVVNCATGDETDLQTDIAIGGRGPGLRVTRAYDGLSAAGASSSGVWGFGWTGPYGAHLEVSGGVATVYQDNGSGVVFYESGSEFTQGGWVQARLVKEGTSYVYTLPDQNQLEFNSEGYLTKETDRNGNSNTLTYNGSHQLEKVTDGTSRSLTFKYNGEGLVESVKDPMGHTVSYTYSSKNLASVTVEGKVRWEFEYESPHLLTKIKDGRGHSATTKYDGSHRVIEQTIGGHTRKWSYGTPAGTETTLTEPNGSETVEHFNAAEEPTKVTRAKGTAIETTSEYEYNSETFNLTKMIDPNGHETKYTYDEEGNKTSEVDPNGDERKWKYDSKHNVTEETSPGAETTKITRNEHGEPEVTERTIGTETQKTEYKYGAHGELTETKDPLSHVTKFTYDADGNKEKEIDPESDERKWKYNEDSQVTEETSPRGFTTKTERDEQGRPKKTTDPLGHITEYKYDGNGNIESEKDGNAHTTKYEYSEENLPIKVTKPNGDTTETGYDAEGQKTSYTDGNTHIWEYKRNALEQVTEEKNPLEKIWKKTYELAGNLEKLEDPEKHVTEYAYDETNRLKKIKYSTGKPSEVTYEYNKDSKVTKMKDETGTTENTWDKLDRLTEYKNGAGKTVKYEYNLANLPVKITYPNGEHITREYDKDNRLSKVTDWRGQVFTFKYNADSKLTSTTFPAESKNKDEYAYNEADQMAEIKMLKGTETYSILGYERDGDGQVTKTTEGAEGFEPLTITSVLDENNRLIEYNKHAYTYDKADNPTKIEGEAGYTYNTADQLKEGPTAKYTYNEDGQRTKLEPKSGEPATTYGYDQAGHLTSTEREKGPKQTELHESITFDGNGLTQEITVNGIKQTAAWDTAEPLPIVLEDETGGEEEASYIYGPENLPIEESFGLNGIYLHHDQQGSTLLVTYWQEGAVVGLKTYGPFGNTIEAAGDTIPLGYDGQITDPETGLIWLGARRYDTSTAQFMSIDPALQETDEPYGYTLEDPENYADPSGECTTVDPLLCASALLWYASAAAEFWVPPIGTAAAVLQLGAAAAAVLAACHEKKPVPPAPPPPVAPPPPKPVLKPPPTVSVTLKPPPTVSATLKPV